MQTYTFSEYRQMQEMSKMDKFLGHLKKHQEEYTKLVFAIAVITPRVCLVSAAAGINEAELGGIANEIIQLGLTFAKYGCMIKGLMNMTNSMLEGSNVKEALGEGISYFAFFLILNYYPKIFSMLKL